MPTPIRKPATNQAARPILSLAIFRLALVTLACVLATLAVAFAQVAISQLGPDGVTVKGRVAETFGDKFILEDETGRILVETRPSPGQVSGIKVGETLLVTGMPRERVMRARRVTRENGDVVFTETAVTPPVSVVPPMVTTGPTSQMTALNPREGALSADMIADVLRPIGLTAMGEAVRHPKHIEIPARTADGTEWVVSLDRFGRLWEIEDANHEPHDARQSRLISIADADRALRENGFAPRGEIERKKHHFQALTTNARGEMVEVHIDRAGYIYKQAWIR